MTRRTQSTSGLALLSALASLAVIFSLSSAFVQTATADLRMTERAASAIHLRYAVEAGLTYALHDYKTWVLPCDKRLPQSIDRDTLGADVAVHVRELPPDRVEFVSTAWTGTDSKTVTAIYQYDVLMDRWEH